MSQGALAALTPLVVVIVAFIIGVIAIIVERSRRPELPRSASNEKSSGKG